MGAIGPGGRPGSAVTNSEFLLAVLRAAMRGTTVWTCAFIGNPNGAEAMWGGAPYDPARMAAVVDGWGRQNTYFSVAAVKRLDDGRFHRTKLAFDRLLVLVGDDVALDDIIGSPSYVLNTSPGKCQVGVLLDGSDPDCENAELVSALMQRMARQGYVALDKAGNNLVRYVRLVVGQNQKPRESGHYDHELVTWAPSVRLTLDDAAAVFGIDLDEVKAELAAAPRDAGGAKAIGPVEFQDEKIRRLSRSIIAGDELHDSTRDLAASLVASGAHRGTVVTMVQALMELSHAQRTRPGEWQARYRDIGRLVDDAEAKFRRGATIDANTGEILEPEGESLFVSAEELIANLTNARYVIEGLLEEDALSMVYGPPGKGKSFVAIAIACAVATGMMWFGRKVKKGPVFYIAGEGHGGIRRRLAAWAKKNGVSLAGAPLYVSRRAVRMTDRDAAEQLGREVERMVQQTGVDPVLVIVDTMHRNFGDADENSSQDVGTYFANLDEFVRARWKCHAMTVHHSGHQAGRARGSSAIKATLDQEFEVDGLAPKVMVTCTKMKDGDMPPELSFAIEKVENLAIDPVTGEPVSGATLVADGNPFDWPLGPAATGGGEVPVEALMQELRDRGWQGNEVTAAAVGMTVATFRRGLKKAIEAGVVEKDGRGFKVSDSALDLWSRRGALLPAPGAARPPRAPETEDGDA